MAVGTRVGRADGAEKYAVILAQARFGQAISEGAGQRMRTDHRGLDHALPRRRALSTTIAGRSILEWNPSAKSSGTTTQSPDRAITVPMAGSFEIQVRQFDVDTGHRRGDRRPYSPRGGREPGITAAVRDEHQFGRMHSRSDEFGFLQVQRRQCVAHQTRGQGVAALRVDQQQAARLPVHLIVVGDDRLGGLHRDPADLVEAPPCSERRPASGSARRTARRPADDRLRGAGAVLEQQSGAGTQWLLGEPAHGGGELLNRFRRVGSGGDHVTAGGVHVVGEEQGDAAAGVRGGWPSGVSI